MATGQQVALTRSHRMPSTSTHISKAARQVVPAFLQKLYEMVNDPNNAELIRWSETGDSFFVLDHERFAHDVLGKWFKHRNFSSFVRQLNMYGFHKIPHLQQGVLKSDTDTEFWNFAHANFHRGQPDLLCLIQRKKQAPQQGDESTLELRDATNSVGLLGTTNVATGTSPTTLSHGQVLDIHSIITGINSIKRHQTTISAELNELKRSNQILWQDALATRTRHQKQQDTINRIVKFLAGVFGSHSAGVGISASGETPNVGGGHGDQNGNDHMSGRRRQMRLMIEDAKRDGPAKSMVEELAEIPTDVDDLMHFADTPISIPSPTPVNDGVSLLNGENPSTNSVTPQHPPQPVPVSAESQGNQISRAVSPNRSPTAIEFDTRIHNMITQLSPSQIHQLLASLAAQTITDPAPTATEQVNPAASSSLTPYLPHYDLSQTNPPFNSLPFVDSLISFDNLDPQLPGDNANAIVSSDQHVYEDQMDKQWRAAEDIDKDVSALTVSINSLIQNFGLDPNLFDGADLNHTEANGTSGTSLAQPTVTDFDFDSLFNGLSNSPDPALDTSNPGGQTMGMDFVPGIGSGMDNLMSATFAIDTPSVSSDMTASPVLSSPAANLSTPNRSGNGVSPFSTTNAMGKNTNGKKRKSENIVDIELPTTLSNPPKAGKTKRRKEK